MTKDEALKMRVEQDEQWEKLVNRKWQGLTDDEVDDLMYQYCDTDNGYSIKSIIKLVEQRLERRNNHD